MIQWRKRFIGPDFYASETLAQLDPLTRIFFSGLWCLADKEGRLEDRPPWLKAQILPYDTADGETMVAALADLGILHRYTVGRKRFLSMPTWREYQSPGSRETPSTIPAPPDSKTPKGPEPSAQSETEPAEGSRTFRTVENEPAEGSEPSAQSETNPPKGPSLPREVRLDVDVDVDVDTDRDRDNTPLTPQGGAAPNGETNGHPRRLRLRDRVLIGKPGTSDASYIRKPVPGLPGWKSLADPETHKIKWFEHEGSEEIYSEAQFLELSLAGDPTR